MPYINKEDRQNNSRKYRLANLDKIKENHKKDYLKNKERYLEQAKQNAKKRKEENPEKFRDLALARIKKYKKTSKGIYNIIRKRSKGKEIISQEDFIEWHSNQEKICSYCEIPETLLDYIKNKNGRQRLSIDRIDNDKGYELGNLCLACFTCNCVKNTVFDSKTMKLLAIKFIKPLWHSKIK